MGRIKRNIINNGLISRNVERINLEEREMILFSQIQVFDIRVVHFVTDPVPSVSYV